MAGKTSPKNALANLRATAKSRLGEIKAIKKLRSMDKRELKKVGITAAVSATAGGYAGYKAQEYIVSSDKVPENMKAPLGIPLTTILGVAGAIVAGKKLSGTQAVVASSALGGLAGGGFAYKLANG
jgi:hypothetical protein